MGSMSIIFDQFRSIIRIYGQNVQLLVKSFSDQIVQICGKYSRIKLTKLSHFGRFCAYMDKNGKILKIQMGIFLGKWASLMLDLFELKWLILDNFSHIWNKMGKLVEIYFPQMWINYWQFYLDQNKLKWLILDRSAHIWNNLGDFYQK